MKRSILLVNYVLLLLSLITTVLSIEIDIQLALYGNRANPKNMPEGMVANPRFNKDLGESEKNPKLIKKPAIIKSSVDMFGYAGRMDETSGDIDLTQLEELAREAYKKMVLVHDEREKANRKLLATDQDKRAPTNLPAMMTAMRPGGPGTPIYFHSSVRGMPSGMGINKMDDTPIHAAIVQVLDDCAAYYDITHRNEANCGEIMALNEYAKAQNLDNEKPINLYDTNGKLVVTVGRVKDDVKVISPCTVRTSNTVTQETSEVTGKEKATNEETEKKPMKTWGCKEFIARVGFQVCEIGWTPNEAPTDEEWTLLAKLEGPKRRWITGLDNLIRRQARPKETKKGPSAANSKKKGTPGATKKGTPGATKKGTPGATKKGTPGAKKKGTPGATKKGTPGATKKGTPGAKKKGTLGAEKKGTPGAKKKGTPGAEKKAGNNRTKKGTSAAKNKAGGKERAQGGAPACSLKPINFGGIGSSRRNASTKNTTGKAAVSKERKGTKSSVKSSQASLKKQPRKRPSRKDRQRGKS